MRTARASFVWPLTALLAVVALATSLLIAQPWRTAGAPAPLSNRLGPSTLHWSSCSPELLCAKLEVPVDYDDPEGFRIGVRLMLLPASGRGEKIGSIVINPGGPGASGMAFLATAWDRFPEALRRRFDIVTFDPRGIGRSVEADCAPTYDAFRADPDSCSGRLYAHLGSDDVARDMDAIRVALGDRRLNYIGFSYGTVIGAAYVKAFPKNARAIVLDGALDPSLDAGETLVGQATGFQREFDGMFDECAADPGCPFYSGGDPRREFARLIDEESPSRRVATRLGVMYWLYLDTAGRERLLEALGSWSDTGDPGDVEELTGGATAGTSDVFAAVWCADFVQPHDRSGTLRSLRDASPDFADVFAHEIESCSPEIERKEALGPVRAAGAPPIVVVGSTGDPATPYEWSKALAAQLDSGVLLTRDGAGHTAYFNSACVQGALAEYFLSERPPGDGTTCD